MLSEKELENEIDLIKSKISKYEKKLKPFKDLQDKCQKEINDKLKPSRFSDEFNVTITIKQKSVLEAQLKRWRYELMIYNRILEGKRMQPLDDRYIE